MNSLSAQVFFRSAQPIWPTGRETEKNLTCGFRSIFNDNASRPIYLKITGSSLYRVFLNGVFIAHGPARAGHGYYRVDEINLQSKIKNGKNILAIEVVGYNVNSYYLLDQPAFLQAELVSGDQTLAATGNASFQATLLNHRVQKVPRYSFQRPFIECYSLTSDYADWRNTTVPLKTTVNFEIVKSKALLPRQVSYPDYHILYPMEVLAQGTVQTNIKRESYWKDRSLTAIGPQLKGFTEGELVINPSIELQEMNFTRKRQNNYKYQLNKTTINVTPGSFQILDLGFNCSGFIGISLNALKGGRVYLTFDEVLTNGDVDFKRLDCINAITFDLTPGHYDLESFEPYTARYLKIIAIDADIKISKLYVRELANSETNQASFSSSNTQLNRIYKAGVETFKQNATDVFMDCPSRERAGWLCDSYFSARVAKDLNGHTRIEKNFFENFTLPDSFPHLPSGMLPMCYPADHNDGVFIPNWSLWFILQLQEYFVRSRDTALLHQLKPRVVDLLHYFESFKNEDGLLENLDSWVFIEWSEANNFVQDVNYPTNMLYAAALAAAGKLYQQDGWIYEAEDIRKVIRKQAFNGQFFVDNAIRSKKSRRIEITTNTSEVCQYFAFYFDVATPYVYPTLWHNLVYNFGPQRSQHNLFPEVTTANAFVGNYLRLELLSRYKFHSKLFAECLQYFDYMAEQTGTLWENISATASCNHGFASHAVHLIYRDILGLKHVDPIHKKIYIQFNDLPLVTCSGQVPFEDGLIKIQWQKKGSSATHTIQIPPGYQLDIENHSTLTLSTKLDFRSGK